MILQKSAGDNVSEVANTVEPFLPITMDTVSE